MARSAQTVRQLALGDEITEAAIEGAVSAFLSDHTIGWFALGPDFTLDLARTVGADRWASAVLRTRGIGETTRRTAVRSAILSGQPDRR